MAALATGEVHLWLGALQVEAKARMGVVVERGTLAEAAEDLPEEEAAAPTMLHPWPSLHPLLQQLAEQARTPQ